MITRRRMVDFPPNANRSVRIRSKGMPHLGDPKTRGDLFARVRLVLPDALTDQEVNSISALVSARQERALPNEVQP